MGKDLEHKLKKSRRGHPDRNYYAYGGLAVLALGAGIAYLGMKDSRVPAMSPIKNEAVDKPSRVLQPRIEVKTPAITFDQAYADISLRAEHVRQSAQSVGIDLNKYSVAYDHDKSKTIDALFTTQSGNPRAQFAPDWTITYLSPVIQTREKIAE